MEAHELKRGVHTMPYFPSKMLFILKLKMVFRNTSKRTVRVSQLHWKIKASNKNERNKSKSKNASNMDMA